MSQSSKFVPLLACTFVLCAALGLSLVSSKAAQLGAQAVGVQSTPRPVFEKREFRAPSLATQRTVGVVNSLNAKKNISKGVSPDG